MTPEQQIKAVAELDGIYFGPADYDPEHGWRYQGTQCSVLGLKPYLSSRDAIIPVITKLWSEDNSNPNYSGPILNGITFGKELAKLLEDKPEPNQWTFIIGLLATPAQLCEALLRASNKWIE